MEKLKRKEPEMKEIPRRIDYLRSKQSNHLTAMVGTGVSFIFGLFSIKELLLFIPFSIMIFSIFLHFFSKYRFYLIAESVLLFQAGLAGHEPVRKLFMGKSYPRRSYWWEDGKWFNQLIEKTNNEHRKRSFIYWILLLTPRWRKETFCHCVIWGSVVFLRLFKDSLKTLLNILNLYDCMSSIIISILKFMKIKQDFYCFSWFLVLLAFLLSGLILISREKIWRRNISDFEEENKGRKILFNGKELTITEYAEEVLYPQHMKEKSGLSDLTKLTENLDLMKPLYMEAKKFKPVEKDIRGIAEDTATSCWVALKLFKYKKEDEILEKEVESFFVSR